jgi:fatty-acyl-CoA synthase
MLNFTRALERNARNSPDQAAYTFCGQSTSNAQLLERVSALAAAFKDQGIGRGDVVALLLGNCPQFLETTLAVNALGAIWLPLNYRLVLDEWRYIVGHAEAKLLLTQPDYHEAGAALRDELPALEKGWTIAADAPPGWSAFEAELTAHFDTPVREFADMGTDDVQRLMYTSGTTARPKGVPLSYGNLHWKNVAHIIEFGLTSADRTLIAGPMYHVGAMDLPASGVIYAGGDVVILPEFDPEAVLATIERERITNVWLPPSMVNLVLAHPDNDRYDLTSLRLVISGGEKMPEPLVQRILDLFSSAWFADAYGLTETVSGDTFLDRDHVLAKLGSVGRPVAHLDLRIVDDDGHPLPAGERGEIALRGPKVFSGYWRDPDATAAAIRNGWFHTGDVGRLDDDGYLYIDDRKKDLIISGGENIASPEVERVLYEHPAVLEAAVIGMPNERWGEVPMAIVVCKSGAEVSGEELTGFCAGRLAKFKVPKRVDFVDELPRTPSGKVLKRTLRERLTLTDAD